MTILAISTVHTKICGLASMSSHVLKCACLGLHNDEDIQYSDC